MRRVVSAVALTPEVVWSRHYVIAEKSTQPAFGSHMLPATPVNYVQRPSVSLPFNDVIFSVPLPLLPPGQGR